MVSIAKDTLLKWGNAFLYADTEGNVAGESGHGLYYEDTRHLSGYAISLEGQRLKCISTSTPNNYSLRVDLVEERGRRDSDLYVRRDIVLAEGLFERTELSNLGDSERTLSAVLALGVDFQDIFEVRDIVPPRQRRPRTMGGGDQITWLRRGEDKVTRWTNISFQPVPSSPKGSRAIWNLTLGPKETTLIRTRVDFGIGTPEERVRVASMKPFIESVEEERQEGIGLWARMETDNGPLSSWLSRSLNDSVDLLIAADGYRVPAAGLPWYATLFGRDSLVVGLETVHLNPHLSMDILRVLALRQGRTFDPYREEETGRILHELRRGELAGSGKIPHGPYYGSVDATPLFLCLLSEVYLWTGDLGFCKELYPSALAAAQHIDDLMERSPKGFLSYVSSDPPGLMHKGWKDSKFGVVHPDGSQPEPPIALCEAQGYAYWGLKGLATIAEALGDEGRGRELETMARELQLRFEEAFWVPSASGYAMALDGSGEQIRTRTSNPGHLLMCRILEPGRASKVAERLMGEDSFSGWGVRTMSDEEIPYHPLSYHNGSVWPQDNALIAWGMSRYGLQEEASMLFEAILAASRGFHRYRLPELFAGFARQREHSPVPVPRACDWQAWSAAVSFLMLRGLLGLEAGASVGKLRVKPFLPPMVDRLEVRSLRVGNVLLDLLIEGEGANSEFRILKEQGPGIELCQDF